MRVGITILTDEPWSVTRSRWQRAEELGFDHAWTYDHLVWEGLPESDWYGAMPVLAAAATVTSRIGLGLHVTSPNFRHPASFIREILAVDDISDGRFLLGAGVGGNVDARTLGLDLPLKERVARFQEFARLLRRVLDEDHVSFDGTYFTAADARTRPGASRVPLLIAANAPRNLRLAAEIGDGWVTYGKKSDADEDWWRSVAELSSQLDDLEVGPDFQRHLSVDIQRYALTSADYFEEVLGRAGELGFTDVVTHWPRPEGPYAGSEDVLEIVAAQVLSRR